MTPKITFLVRRLLQAVITVIGLAIINFFTLSLAPGDVVDAMIAASGASSEGYADVLRETLGLQQSWWGRLISYLGGLATFDFGYSYSLNKPVLDAILERLGPTFILMGGAIILALLLGVIFGLVSGFRNGGWVDRFISLLSLIGYATPLFWLGLLLILLFSVQLNILPSGGMRPIGPAKGGLEGIMDVARHAILPILTLTLYYMAIFTRVMRASVIEVLSMDFIKTARAKGMSEWRVLWRHILGNAILPVFTMLGLQIAAMLGGAVVIETIFSWPGLGRLAVDAIFARDLTLLMGILFLSSLCVVITNLIIDMLYSVVDPRIQLSKGS